MGTPFDQLGKKIGLRALGPSGLTTAEHELASNAHRADLLHDPDPAREGERARLGLLGRLASVPCLIELFSAAPGEEKVIDCVGKLVAFRQERRRQADKLGPKQTGKGSGTPTARLVRPFLWIIAAGRPSSVISALGAVRAGGWPPGVYVSPGRSPELGGLLRLGIVVANELPRTRETVLVRIIAGGPGLVAALADLAALPVDAHEREIASTDVLELRRALGSKADKTVEEEEIMDAIEELRDEGRREGRDEGRAEARSRDVLTVLRVRGIGVSDAVRERVLAEKDPERLERWLEKAVVATSLAEVLDEPS